MQNKLTKATLVAALATLPALSQAALPTEATQAFTDVGTAITDSAAAAWPVVAAGIVAVLTFKLVKRFLGKV